MPIHFATDRFLGIETIKGQLMLRWRSVNAPPDDREYLETADMFMEDVGKLGRTGAEPSIGIKTALNTLLAAYPRNVKEQKVNAPSTHGRTITPY